MLTRALSVKKSLLIANADIKDQYKGCAARTVSFLGRIVYYDEEQDRELTFLTDALSLEEQNVADLYKNRWQIELFFKWMRQHLNIQRYGEQPKMQ